jgi:acetylglutamate kinase
LTRVAGRAIFPDLCLGRGGLCEERVMESAIQKADILVEAMPYIQRFRRKIVVVKLGGSAIENPEALQGVLEDVAFLQAVGTRPVLVHGGGKFITEAMADEGLEPRFIEGLRCTGEATLKVAIRVLCDELNSRIVAGIKKAGGAAAPCHPGRLVCMRASRREATDRSGVPVDLGWVGDVTHVDEALLADITASDVVPVVAPIVKGFGEELYNVNADAVAGEIARAMRSEKAVFMSDTHGILRDPSDPDSLASTLYEDEVRRMIAAGTISGGMMPKVEACLRALDAGVGKAHIVDGRIRHSVLLEIFTGRGVGTQILKRM